MLTQSFPTPSATNNQVRQQPQFGWSAKGHPQKTDLREELSESISFREGDRDISISKQRALIKRLVASAIEGDARSIQGSRLSRTDSLVGRSKLR
jgi:hypothetical protein